MRVLVGCEFSGIVRDAFIAAGHDAWSCDILPSERPGPHIQGDVLDVLDDGWDLAVFHPPCTYLANSGARWLYTKDADGNRVPNSERWINMFDGAWFFRKLLDAPIPRIAVENPIQHRHAREAIGRAPDQIIQPWQFGHPESKATCLWLKDLPPLEPTNNVHEHMMSLPLKERTRVHYMSPGATRGLERSRFYEGIAAAMAAQWGAIDPTKPTDRETEAHARQEVAP